MNFKANTNYTRVTPRDLFNESKLLKCMGLLCLKILNGKGLGLINECNDDFEGSFKIGLIEDAALLTISNLHITFNDERVIFGSRYNSKANYPLVCFHNYCEYEVFTDNGEFSEEFIEFLKTL